MTSPSETPCEILSICCGAFAAFIAFVFTTPESASVLAPVAMLVTAGACSASCVSGCGLDWFDDPFWTISTGAASVFSAAGALALVSPSSADAALAGAEVLTAGPSAVTAAEGLDGAVTTVAPFGTGSACGAPTSTVSGWDSAEAAGCGGRVAVSELAGTADCGAAGWGCDDCILVQPK